MNADLLNLHSASCPRPSGRQVLGKPKRERERYKFFNVLCFLVCLRVTATAQTINIMHLILFYQALRIMVYYGVVASTVAMLHTLACLVSLWRRKSKKTVRREMTHPNGAIHAPPHPTARTSLAYEPMRPSPIPRLEGNVIYCNVPNDRVQSENLVEPQLGPTAPQEDILRAYARSIPIYWNPVEEDYRSFY